MNCKIKLRNNHWVDATALSNDLFEVALTKGVKVYALNEIKEVEYTEEEITMEIPEINTNNNVEESHMDTNSIKHYLEELTFSGGEKVYRRTITNVLPVNVTESYWRSVETRKVSGSILAINTGNWRLRLIEEQLVKKNIPFTIHVLDHNEVTALEGWAERVAKMVHNATFVFANASLAFYLTIHVDGATLETMGISAKHMRKTAKRLQELTRLSEMSWHMLEDQPSLSIGTYDDDSNDPASYYDGMSYMRQSVAISAAYAIEDTTRRHNVIRQIRSGKMTRFTIRLMTDGWLMKGDLIVVPDDQLDSDIVTYSENLKSEVYTNGFSHLTMWEHAPRHTAVWDMQSSINFGQALPERKEISDINRVVSTTVAAMQDNTIPSWMLLGENAHNDDGTINMEKLSESLHMNHIRWQSNGLDIRSAQNLTFMALNGVVKRMEAADMRSSRITGNVPVRRKKWVPMTNAVLGAVNTYESAVNMGGFTFPDRNPNVVFWDDRMGLVIPGKRFEETYKLHGGWDLDDSVKAIWIKLHSTEDYSVHRGVTIPSNMMLPSDKENAIDALLLVRSPNGPGEYSIEFFDSEGMFDEDMIDPNQIINVDLTKMPLPQGELLAKVGEFRGMPTSTEYTRQEMTKIEMLDMVMSQAQNPSVGAYCNAIMVYYYSMRRFPTLMLDVMETIVDASQQGYDLASFEAIKAETNSIWEQLVAECESGDVKVEAALATSKMPTKVQAAVVDNMVRGRFARTEVVYNKAINTLKDIISNTTMQWRYDSPLVRRLAAKPMDPKFRSVCNKLYYGWTFKLEGVDRTFKTSEFDHPFAKMINQANKQLAFHAIVDEMVEHFDNITDESERYMLIVNLYKWTVLGQRQDDAKMKLGLKDRIFFQPNGMGKRCLMDILIEGVKYYNLV